MEELENCLDASIFLETSRVYSNDFENLMHNIYGCYEYMLIDGITVPYNDENSIRDILYKYISKTSIRNNICIIHGYRMEKEVDENSGRVDLKIIDINDFENYDAYYIIECKRLDGSSTLNKAYIEDGIKRFTTNYKANSSEAYYSSYYGISGMVGFVVKEVDIDKNINNIGTFFNSIEKNKLYDSTHQSLKLFHLMMDFSKNIK